MLHRNVFKAISYLWQQQNLGKSSYSSSLVSNITDIRKVETAPISVNRRTDVRSTWCFHDYVKEPKIWQSPETE